MSAEADHGCSPVILVLRPDSQAASTLSALQKQNWHTIHFPTIAINDAANLNIHQASAKLSQADWVFFISRNAVHYFLKHFDPVLLSNAKLAAVGNATSDALRQAGISVDLQPAEAFTSEELLDSPHLSDMSNQQAVIIRGNGGREHLAQSLRSRGASVEYVEVYQRIIADQDCGKLKQQWNSISAILATSNQLLDNLLLLCNDTFADSLLKKPLVVISPRMAEHARILGFNCIWQASTASNEAIIDTIVKNNAKPH